MMALIGADTPLKPFAADYADERRWGKPITEVLGTKKNERQRRLNAPAQ